MRIELGSYADIPHKHLGWMAVADELQSRFLASGRNSISGFVWIGFTWYTKKPHTVKPSRLVDIWTWLLETFSRFIEDVSQVGIDRCRISTARELPRLVVTLTT